MKISLSVEDRTVFVCELSQLLCRDAPRGMTYPPKPLKSYPRVSIMVLDGSSMYDNLIVSLGFNNFTQCTFNYHKYLNSAPSFLNLLNHASFIKNTSRSIHANVVLLSSPLVERSGWYPFVGWWSTSKLRVIIEWIFFWKCKINIITANIITTKIVCHLSHCRPCFRIDQEQSNPNFNTSSISSW